MNFNYCYISHDRLNIKIPNYGTYSEISQLHIYIYVLLTLLQHWRHFPCSRAYRLQKFPSFSTVYCKQWQAHGGSGGVSPPPPNMYKTVWNLVQQKPANKNLHFLRAYILINFSEFVPKIILKLFCVKLKRETEYQILHWLSKSSPKSAIIGRINKNCKSWWSLSLALFVNFNASERGYLPLVSSSGVL